jgi:hypothetical protein
MHWFSNDSSFEVKSKLKAKPAKSKLGSCVRYPNMFGGVWIYGAEHRITTLSLVFFY